MALGTSSIPQVAYIKTFTCGLSFINLGKNAQEMGRHSVERSTFITDDCVYNSLRVKRLGRVYYTCTV